MWLVSSILVRMSDKISKNSLLRIHCSKIGFVQQKCRTARYLVDQMSGHKTFFSWRLFPDSKWIKFEIFKPVIVEWTFRNKLPWILNKIPHFLFKEMQMKILSTKCQPFCSGFNAFTHCGLGMLYCLMAPSHYLYQCWLKIINIHPSAISQKMCHACRQRLSFKIKFSKKNFHLAGSNELTHLPLMPHICVSKSGQHWFR